jgi:predicted dehydrogenase
MGEEPIKVAIVGWGAVSQRFYAPALQTLARLDRLHVAAVYDPHPVQANACLQNFPDAIISSDLSQLAARGAQLAIVASPTALHAKQSVELLQSGLHVLCEKPMASSVEEAKAMVEAAEEAGRLLSVGLYRRFYPAAVYIKEMVDKGILGAVESVQVNDGGVFNWPVQSMALFQKASSAGGVLLDFGTHILDLILWWLGKPSKVEYFDDAMGGLEANCEVHLEFDKSRCRIRLTRDWSSTNRCTIRFERGWMVWDTLEPSNLEIGFDDSRFAIAGKVGDVLPENAGPIVIAKSSIHQCFVQQLTNLIDAIQGKASLVVPATEAIQSLTVIQSCYANRQLIPMPWMSKPEIERAETLNRESRSQCAK